MGQRVVELEPVHGFAAETTAATVLARHGPFRDAGVDDACHLERHHGRRLRAGPEGVRWGVARRILVAWIITIPCAGAIAALAWVVLNFIGFGG